MGDRPKRNRRAPERYEPDEVPIDDYDDETGETAEEQVYKKRWRGEFDELDDEDEEELDEPDEYDVNDGFAVPDDFEESDEDDDEEEDFDEEEEDEEDDSLENSFEPDVAEPEEPEESY